MTGSNKGSHIKTARVVDKYLLLLACRHHITELRMVQFYEAVIKEKFIGPDNPLFKKFKQIFEDPEYEYDKVNLESFDWKIAEGTVLKDAVHHVRFLGKSLYCLRT